MKRTLDIPDVVYRQVRKCATLRGETVKAFLLKAIQDKVSVEKSGTAIYLVQDEVYPDKGHMPSVGQAGNRTGR